MSNTIKDVSNIANTSVATVSRYLNGKGNVSDELKERIEKAIIQLKYTPQRKHLPKSTKSIGLIFPDLSNHYYLPVIVGLEKSLSIENYHLLICSNHNSIDIEKTHIVNLIDKQVDGIILLGTRPITESNSHIIKLSEKIPTVIINDSILGSKAYSIVVEEAEGAYSAIQYLISLGHKKIGFINGELNYTTYRNKNIGFEKALFDNGIPKNMEYITEQDPHEEGGYEGALQILSLKNPPTAIFAASDQMAFGVMKACYQMKLRIPDDISIIGFSNTPIAKSCYPELTTINQHPEKVGQMAASIMCKLIKQQKIIQHETVLKTDLIIRDSCAPPKTE